MTGWMREVTEVIEEVNGAHAITGSLSVTRGRTISDFRGCWELDSMISLGMDFYVVHNSVCVCGGGVQSRVPYRFYSLKLWKLTVQITH